MSGVVWVLTEEIPYSHSVVHVILGHKPDADEIRKNFVHKLTDSQIERLLASEWVELNHSAVMLEEWELGWD